MTTNTNVRLEFFAASDAEDSDPDSTDFNAPTAADVIDLLATHLEVSASNLHFEWIERDGDADRYSVLLKDAPAISLGVAYITHDTKTV